MLGTELAVAFLETVGHHRDADGGSLQFDTTALSALRDVAASAGRCTAVLPVTPPVSNRYGTLHGGCIGRCCLAGCGGHTLAEPQHLMPAPRPPARLPAATLVDTVGSAALITLSPRGGVSLNINVNYLSKMPVGGNVLIEAQVGGRVGGWAGG